MTAEHILATLFAGTNEAEGYAAAQRELAGIIERERRAANADAVDRIRELLAQWRSDRLGYPTDDSRASVAFVVVKLCEEELRAVVDAIERGEP